MNIAFRVDVSEQIGTGHLTRCLTLAGELQNAGWKATFFCRWLPEFWQGELPGLGFDHVMIGNGKEETAVPSTEHSDWLGVSQETDARDTMESMHGVDWDWLVVDHYALCARYETELRARAASIMVIDDLADREHDCDVLLDQNQYSDMETRYIGMVPPHCRKLMGPKYALLREEFRQQRQIARTRDGKVRRILVFFGGVDARNVTLEAIRALAEIKTGQFEVDVVVGGLSPFRQQIIDTCNSNGFHAHVQTNEIAKLMSNADLAIGAGGSTSWERCCLGLPTFAIPLALNQQRLVNDAALSGLLYAPSLTAGSGSSLKDHIRCLLENPLLLQLISRNGRKAVDGYGVQRVAQTLGAVPVVVRSALPTDSGMILKWRNSLDVRTFSGNGEPVAAELHDEWYHSVLDNPQRALLVGEVDGDAVGCVRFDIDRNTAEISIFLSPAHIGRGLGFALLGSAENWLRGHRPDVRTLLAKVKDDNRRSHRLFGDSGYCRDASTYTKRLDKDA